MTLYFSFIEQAFYDTQFNYPKLPEDIIEITKEKYDALLFLKNEGRVILKDLTYSTPRPSIYHNFVDNKWIDPRTIEEKRIHYLEKLKPLTRRQFKLVLLEHDLLDKVEEAIRLIPDTKLRTKALIEWEDATSFERSNETLNSLYPLMGLKESQVDQMWEAALKL